MARRRGRHADTCAPRAVSFRTRLLQGEIYLPAKCEAADRSPSLSIAAPIVPFRVRFDNNNTVRVLELSLQAAGTDE